MSSQAPIAIAFKAFPITLLIMVVCIGLFLLQIFSGVDASQPTNDDLIRWGANFMPYSLHNDSWRMFSSLVLHIGLLHLMFNMFALYQFGQIAERMFGSINLLVLFLLSGVGGNLLSNYWDLQQFSHQPPTINAGASGGIMGIGMALLIVSLRKSGFNGFKLDFRFLFIIMALNLGYGFLVSGINNAGHLGGAIMGAILAFIYLLENRLKNQSFFTNPLKTPMILISYCLLIGAFVLTYQQLHEEFLYLLKLALLKYRLSQ